MVDVQIVLEIVLTLILRHKNAKIVQEINNMIKLKEDA
jgi:hypothetical protein